MSDDSQPKLSAGRTAQDSQLDVGINSGMVDEVLADTSNPHGGDVDMPPDFMTWDIHAKTVDVLAGHHAINDRLRLDVRRFLLLGTPRVEASVLICHGETLPRNHTHTPPRGRAVRRDGTSCSAVDRAPPHTTQGGKRDRVSTGVDLQSREKTLVQEKQEPPDHCAARVEDLPLGGYRTGRSRAGKVGVKRRESNGPASAHAPLLRQHSSDLLA